MMREQSRRQDEEDRRRQAEIDAKHAKQKLIMERMQNTVFAQIASADKEGDIRAEQQRAEADKRAVCLNFTVDVLQHLHGSPYLIISSMSLVFTISTSIL